MNKAIILTAGILMTTISFDAMAREAGDTARRASDRIVIVEKGRTYSLPAPRGSGRTVVTYPRTLEQIERKVERENRRDKARRREK